MKKDYCSGHIIHLCYPTSKELGRSISMFLKKHKIDKRTDVVLGRDSVMEMNEDVTRKGKWKGILIECNMNQPIKMYRNVTFYPHIDKDCSGIVAY